MKKKVEKIKIPLEHENDTKLHKMSDITWRIFRIMAEFVDGFQFLSESEKEVTIFGSARLEPHTKWYKEAVKLGESLAKEGYIVMTGGGPGIMEAGNKGAFKVNKNLSYGLNIQLPSEQRINRYVGKSVAFYYFFTRKVMLAASSQVYIYFPGGFGTVDEFSEILTLIQTGKMQKTPIVLVGKEFWQPMVDWFEKSMAKDFKTIGPKDTKLFTVVDKAEDVMKVVRKSKERTIF